MSELFLVFKSGNLIFDFHDGDHDREQILFISAVIACELLNLKF